MEDKREIEGYNDPIWLKWDIDRLDDNIENIPNTNIINHKVVDEIEEQINNIDNRIKKTQRNNFKQALIRNIKIFGRKMQKIGPYVLAIGLAFGAQTLIYDVPFIRQNQVKIAEHDVTIDNLGNKSDELSYHDKGSINKNHNVVYTTAWEKKIDGKYYRTVREYQFQNEYRNLYWYQDLISIERLSSYNIFFDNPKSTRYETRDEVSEEELAQGYSVKMIYRYSDELDIIIAAQDVPQNLWFSLLYILTALVFVSPVYAWRHCEDGSNFDYAAAVDKIKRQYPNVNIDELIKLFKEKKIKFSVVKHEQVTMIDPITKHKTIFSK